MVSSPGELDESSDPDHESSENETPATASVEAEDNPSSTTQPESRLPTTAHSFSNPKNRRDDPTVVTVDADGAVHQSGNGGAKSRLKVRGVEKEKLEVEKVGERDVGSAYVDQAGASLPL